MARNTPLYFGVNGIAEKLSKVYFGDPNNVAQEVKKIYEGDANGIARLKYHLHEFIDGNDGFKTCQICNTKEAIPTPDHTHNYTAHVTSPTCTEQGYTTYTCSCGDVYRADYVDAPGHQEVVDSAVAATCTANGLTEGKHCSRCGETLIAQQTISALGHTFVDGICSACKAIDPNCEHTDTNTSEKVTKAATCTKQGSKTVTVTCNICKNVVSTTTESIPALGHTEDEPVHENTVNSTCSRPGSYDVVVYCTTCDTEVSRETVEIPKREHVEEIIPSKSVTCIEDGLTEGKKCSVCGEILVAQENIPAPGHTEEVIKGTAATCTTTGLTDGKQCTVCKKMLVEQQVIPAAHTDENNDNVCDACGESLCDPHSIEIIPAVAATCLTSGWTEGKRCSVCGKVLVPQQEIPADPLNPDAHDLVHLGTYCNGDHLNSGKNLYKCTRDGCKYSIVLNDGLLGDTIHTTPVEHHEVPATCSSNGFTAGITCSNCGADNRQLIPMLAHTEETVTGRAATCSATGLTDGTRCSVCGVTIKAQETIDIIPNAHNRVAGIPVEPTCTDDGYIPHTCKYCGDIEKAVNFGSALGHAAGEAVEESRIDPTCTAEGSQTLVTHCTRCNELLNRETVTLKATGHNRVEGIPVAPTCLEDGYIPYRCKDCGDVENTVNFGSALGHANETVEENRVEPTCTKVGSYDSVVRCSRCGEVQSRTKETIDVLGHNYKVLETVGSTCTENGHTTYKCKRCGDVKEEVIFELADHTPGTATETSRTEPTCTSAGSKTLETRCTECNTLLNSETVTLNATGHDHKAGVYVEPTCEEDGYTPYRCHCGDVENEVNFGSALGHSMDTREENRVEPTCTANGSYDLVSYCTRCGYIQSRQAKTLQKVDHDTTSITFPSTCTENGYTQYNCKNCDYSVREEIFELADHKPGSATETSRTNATCEKAGSYTLETRCTECGTLLDSETIAIPATGHAFIATKTVPATCTEPGYTNYKCKCGETKTETLFELADHQYKAKTTAPTCTAQGYTTHTCSVCGDYYIDSYVNAKGHTEVTIPAVASTCKDTGLTEGKKCSVCDTITVAQTTTPADPNKHSYVGDYCSVCGGKKTGGSIGGCVFAGTQIALDANTSIDIADFVGGTPIDFCNPSTLEHSPQQTLTRFFYEKSTDKVIITLEDDKSLEVTPNHVVLTEEGFKAHLDDYMYPKYAVGDKLATVDGYKAITAIQEEVIPETTVYNIATENSLMVANGIIVAGELNYNISTLALGGDTSKEEFD